MVTNADEDVLKCIVLSTTQRIQFTVIIIIVTVITIIITL